LQFDLKGLTNTLEDSIITLSGPALAISGIIAGVDLLTGGHVLQQVSWLALAWAIALMVSLDFQVLGLGARAHRIYQSEKSSRRKAGEIALAIILAAGISFVSVQMQGIIARSNSAGLDIATATAQLGINPLALIWERSALVLLLIFMSGWFREEQVRQPVSSETPAALSDETVQIILSKLEKLDQLEQALSQPLVVIQETPETPLALPETSETDVKQGSLKEQLERLLSIAPRTTSREAAEILGKPHSTVYRHLKQMKQTEKAR
jgi:hypothetical protein